MEARRRSIAWSHADNVGAGAGSRAARKSDAENRPISPNHPTRARRSPIRGKQQQKTIRYSLNIFKDDARSSLGNVEKPAVQSSAFLVDDNFGAGIVDLPAGMPALFRLFTVARIHHQKCKAETVAQYTIWQIKSVLSRTCRLSFAAAGGYDATFGVNL